MISLYSLFVSKPIVNMVIAEFIFGSESVEAIVEPLKIVQTWNPSWNSQYLSPTTRMQKLLL